MGKAVRSRFTLLLGDALGLERGAAERIGAAAELIHTASLLHDDCIDRAALRRGPHPERKPGDQHRDPGRDMVVSCALITPQNKPGPPADLVGRCAG